MMTTEISENLIGFGNNEDIITREKEPCNIISLKPSLENNHYY